jgi:hypothetical protein
MHTVQFSSTSAMVPRARAAGAPASRAARSTARPWSSPSSGPPSSGITAAPRAGREAALRAAGGAGRASRPGRRPGRRRPASPGRPGPRAPAPCAAGASGPPASSSGVSAGCPSKRRPNISAASRSCQPAPAKTPVSEGSRASSARAAGSQVHAVPAADRPEPDHDVEAGRVLVDGEQHVEEAAVQHLVVADGGDRLDPALPLDVRVSTAYASVTARRAALGQPGGRAPGRASRQRRARRSRAWTGPLDGRTSGPPGGVGPATPVTGSAVAAPRASSALRAAPAGWAGSPARSGPLAAAGRCRARRCTSPSTARRCWRSAPNATTRTGCGSEACRATTSGPAGW